MVMHCFIAESGAPEKVARLGAWALCQAMVRTSYQDYGAWPNYGTLRLWTECRDNPSLAHELIAQHMSKLQLTHPSETTSADIAAGNVVAMYGPDAAIEVGDTEVQNVFTWFKA